MLHFSYGFIQRFDCLAKVLFSCFKSVYNNKKFPKEELFGLSSQMRRVVVSLPSNIAEGNTRSGKKEHIQFFRIAYGSGAELETQLLIAKDLGYIQNELFVESQKELQEVMKMLNALIGNLSKI